MQMNLILKCIFCAMLAIFLGGCMAGQSSTSYIGPSGKTVHQTKCKVDTSGCFQNASNTCGGAYNVLSSESHAGGMLADLLPGPVTWFGMSYECGPSSGNQPTFPFRGPQPTLVPAGVGSGMNNSGTQQQLDQLKRNLATDCINRGGVPTSGGGCI